jgi:hypothetical protein
MATQCLYYALDQWNEIGGYVEFRRSSHWCMPHVLHYDPRTNKRTHYVPPDKLRYPWYSMFGFEGYIKTFDDEDCPPMPPICMFFGTIVLLLLGAVWAFKRFTTRRNKRQVGRDRRASDRPIVNDRRRSNYR